MEPDPEKLEEGGVDKAQSQNKVQFKNNSTEDAGDNNSSRSGRPPSSSSESQASSLASAIHVDIAQPGPWVLHHHKLNLITEVQEPINFKSTYEKLRYHFGIWIHRPVHWLQWFERKLGKQDRQKDHDVEERTEKERDWDHRRFRMSFAELQRMKLRKLQIKLVGLVVSMHRHNHENQEWEATLAEYVKALKDYDYMSSRSKEPMDPFLVTGERDIDHYILSMAMGKFRDHFVSEANTFEKVDSIGPWKDDEAIPIGGTRNENHKESEWKNFRKRLQMAVLGGVFLLAPMWLMVLHRTKYTALVSTTVFVAFFGMIMAKFLEKEMDVLSVTAAYAAVLVVFVGLNT